MMLEISRAEGVYLYTADGRPVMDLISGIGVSALGHCHPAVVQAVQAQTAQYMHTMVYGEFVLTPQVRLAQAISDTLPPGLDAVYFVNSGSEATEGALKLAKKVTGRYQVVAAHAAYHGSTHGSASLMDEAKFTQPFRPLMPGIDHLTFNALDGLSVIDQGTACVILETVQGEAGLIPPDPDFLRAVRARCDEVGALLIFDEIQAGFGRTGSMYAFEHYGVQPDILLLAKGMGGGMPIGAFIASREHMAMLSDNPMLGHITTFGGHPVNCAASLATLQTLQQDGLVAQVQEKHKLFMDLLPHPVIREIRHCGLWFALQLDSWEQMEKAVAMGLDHGLLFDWFLFDDTSIRLAPPLVITSDQIREACAKLHIILDQLGS